MKTQHLIATSAMMLLSATSANAQDNSFNVVSQAVPTQNQVQKHVIVANSPQDIALQEEIRKIHAYNASVDRRVGISDTHSIAAPSYIVATTPRTPDTGASAYHDRQVSLFSAQPTTITYTSSGTQVSTDPINRQISVTPVQATQNYLPASSTQYTRIHRVVEKDTLYTLAKQNCVSVQDIQAQNALNGSGIRIGQVLTLPANQCNATRSIPTSSSVTAPAHTGTQTRSEFGTVRRVEPIHTGIKVHQGNAYAVLPKDSLYSIGKRYCVSAQDLAGFNGINTTDPIQPGQILRLPSDSCM